MDLSEILVDVDGNLVTKSRYIWFDGLVYINSIKESSTDPNEIIFNVSSWPN